MSDTNSGPASEVIEADEHKAKHAAGASDIRNFIGSLIGIYGLVLTVMGVVSYTEEDKLKTGQLNANLIAGIVMLLFGLAFLLWAKVRPTEVPDDFEAPEDGPPAH